MISSQTWEGWRRRCSAHLFILGKYLSHWWLWSLTEMCFISKFFNGHFSKWDLKEISKLLFCTHSSDYYQRVSEQNEMKQWAKPKLEPGQKTALMWWIECNCMFAWASGLATLQVQTSITQSINHMLPVWRGFFFLAEVWSMPIETYMLVLGSEYHIKIQLAKDNYGIHMKVLYLSLKLES